MQNQKRCSEVRFSSLSVHEECQAKVKPVGGEKKGLGFLANRNEFSVFWTGFQHDWKKDGKWIWAFPGSWTV